MLKSMIYVMNTLVDSTCMQRGKNVNCMRLVLKEGKRSGGTQDKVI